KTKTKPPETANPIKYPAGYIAMESNAIRLSELKVGAIVNTSSGSCDLESEEKMLNTLKGAGIAEPRIWCGRADQMAPFFAEAVGRSWTCLSCLGATVPS